MKRKAAKWKSMLRDYAIILSILIAVGAFVVLAPAIGLPWVIGPLPIVATTWTAYGYIKGLIYKRMDEDIRLICSYLLPIGVFSLLGQLAFSEVDVKMLIISCQMLSGVCCVALLCLANYVVTGSVFVRNSRAIHAGAGTTSNSVSRSRSVKIILKCCGIMIIVDCLIFLADPTSKCNGGKCSGGEILIGLKTQVFSSLYVSSLIGSFLAVGLISGIALFYRSFEPPSLRL